MYNLVGQLQIISNGRIDVGGDDKVIIQILKAQNKLYLHHVQFSWTTTDYQQWKNRCGGDDKVIIQISESSE